MITARKRQDGISSFHRLLWGALVVFAVLSRAVIPDGMMPDISGHGHGAVLTICPGHDTRPAQNQHSGHGKMPCPYSVGFITGVHSPDAPVVALLVLVRPVLLFLVDLELSIPQFFGNASSRSPPFFF